MCVALFWALINLKFGEPELCVCVGGGGRGVVCECWCVWQFREGLLDR